MRLTLIDTQKPLLKGRIGEPMIESELIKGQKYKPIHKDFITGKIVKSRKEWEFIGTQTGGLTDGIYYIFDNGTTMKAIPEYLFKGCV